MKKTILLFFVLNNLASSVFAQTIVDTARSRAYNQSTQTPNLFVIDLPAGDVGSINIDWFNNGATKLHAADWLAQGYEGVLFRGQGVDITHIRCTSWDGVTIGVLRQNITVQFENLTIHSGYDRATAFGQQNNSHDYFPDFKIRLVNLKVVVDPPFQYFASAGKFFITNRGSNYAVGDVLTVVGGTGTPAKFRVSSVGINGSIANLDVITRGSYSTSPPFGTGGQPTNSTGIGVGGRIELGQRPKWGVFSYNADMFMQNVFFNAKQAVEHAVYLHGFAKKGATVINSVFAASGAEGFKVRSDATETRWAGPNQIIYIANTLFANWFQPWTWRGGAGVVLQGTGSHIVIEKSKFYGGGALSGGGYYPDITSNQRSLAIAISSEGDSYDQQTGIIGTGYGNGHVYLNQIAASGSSEVLYHNNLIRCGRNSGSQQCARSFQINQSSLWGQNMFVSIANLDSGTGWLQNSNTPALRSFADSIGMNTMYEAVIPRTTLVPVSQGASW